MICSFILSMFIFAWYTNVIMNILKEDWSLFVTHYEVEQGKIDRKNNKYIN